MARLAVYNKAEFKESLLKDSNFTHHKTLGENAKYVFILHTNDAPTNAEQEATPLFHAMSQLQSAITLSTPKAMDQTFNGYIIPTATTLATVGNFKTQTLDGKAIDASVFTKKKLTMVNV